MKRRAWRGERGWRGLERVQCFRYAWRGDTLVEVALAVGIFSMVAISAVSVVNASMSSAQGMLETTLTREQIDAQAEALRFIQANYVAGDAHYRSVWEELVKSAVDLTTNLTAGSEVLEYAPTSCDEVYENLEGAFVVNVRDLAGEGAVVRDVAKFRTAVTYPRVLYGGEDSLFNDNDEVEAVEGIYVVAVKDPETTNIVTSTGSVKKAAYYDFYIRTCWYPAGARRPSTVATVVRLSAPEALVGN